MSFSLNFFLLFFTRMTVLRNFKTQFIKLIFFFCVMLSGSYSFKSLANMCDCEKIRETGECSNPNCAEVCDFQISLNEINQSLIKKCMERDKWLFGFDKYYETLSVGESTENVLRIKVLNQSHYMTNILASQLGSVTEKVLEKIEYIKLKGSQRLKKTCTNCRLIDDIFSDFKGKTPKENCSEEYLKTYEYERSKSFNLKNGTCDRDEVFSDFWEYTLDLLKNPEKNPDSKKLWDACPNPCSFQANYALKIDDKNCAAEMDLKIHCTHKVKRSFFQPSYDMQIVYTGDLKCEGK